MDVEIIGLKGQGYFCDVQKAKDEYGKKVAVKQLKREFVSNPDYVQRFKREVRITRELSDCPFIIPCLDVELDDNSLVYRYTMPLADENLFQFIRSNNTKLSLDQRVAIFDQIVAGIHFAHNKNVIHRDIAPQNVLIFHSEDGIPKVMVSDFGLGKDYKSLSRLSKSVGHYGRAIYVAPEQSENIKDATIKSDIYSLGRLLLFVITGRDPVVIETGDKFGSLIEKATKYDPEQRHKDIDEFIEHYEKLKSLYLGSEVFYYDTMKQYVKSLNGKIDWRNFHQHALKAKVNNHVFDDYIEPIVEVLGRWQKFDSYYSFVKEGIIDFLETFSENLRACLTMTGWPFSYTNKIGKFLVAMHSHLPDPNLKLIVLKDLWELSFEANQWGPQQLMEYIIRRNMHPDNIVAFAEFLTDSSSRYARKIIHSGNLSEIHPIIRTALNQVIERAEEEKRKRNISS